MHIDWNRLDEIEVCQGERKWLASGKDLGVDWATVLVTQTDPG